MNSFLVRLTGVVVLSALIALAWAPSATLAAAKEDPCKKKIEDCRATGGVPLIQPLSGGSCGCAPVSAGAGTFIAYFEDSTDWMFEVAVGFVVIWILVGGFMYMVSGNNQSLRSDAIQKMTWSVIGLMMVLFAGVILRSLNSVFFV